MDNPFSANRNRYNSNVFVNHYISIKTMYLQRFGTLPNIHYIGNIDGEKVYNNFIAAYSHLIVDTYTYKPHYNNNEKYDFDDTILVLSNKCLVHFDETYCNVLYPTAQEAFAQSIVKAASPVKKRARREPAEINLIVQGRNGLELKAMEIKRTKLDIDLFYEDDFVPIHHTISKRLNKKGDKGIVLLHGLPGTGKTSYLRYLVGRIKKKVLFLSPSAAGNLMDPDLIEILIDNPDSVLIVEDAENIIMDRKVNNSSSVSNLLNISDGLLSDFLNVQLICTFNSSLTLIDNALMRKGRLIARYEFGKLGIEKAQRLSDHFGYQRTITQPMTIAEISNQNETSYESKTIQVMGFRREPVYEN
jgi:hypothetical protein